MKKPALLISIFIMWLCIAGLSLLSPNPLSISKITSAIAMFTCGAVFVIYKVLDAMSSFPTILLKRKFIFYVQEVAIFLLTLGYFIYIFMLQDIPNYSALHETSRVILNSATILIVLSMCADRIERLN